MLTRSAAAFCVGLSNPVKAIESGDESVKRLEISTTRLALQNYDWSSLDARELFFVFDSHLKGAEAAPHSAPGALKKVSVYLSDFGQKRLKQEKHHGPRRVFEELKRKFGAAGLLEGAGATALQSLVNSDPLVRQYQINRLRYYYAVLEFDSTAAADWVYQHCDGLEFEKSGMRMDLRGVPPGLEIPKAPSEVAEGVGDLDPKTLKGRRIKNLARSHSHVELSWGAGGLTRGTRARLAESLRKKRGRGLRARAPPRAGLRFRGGRRGSR